ncbi:DUF2157 domain-containing protein [Thermodesulfobacteriota bacterium]
MDNQEIDRPAFDSDPLQQPARREIIGELFTAGHLSHEAREEALNCLRSPPAWWIWANRMLLFLGCALVLAGVIFFFAYNWEKIGPFIKFAVIELGIAASLVGAWVMGLDRLGGKVLLLSASLLVGVVLAVYGQTYQTGADAYELFAGWAVLIAGWVAISRFQALWLTWVTLINIAIIMFWSQVVIPNNLARAETQFALLALINGTVIGSFELLAMRGIIGPVSRWFRSILVLSVSVYLTIGTALFILQELWFIKASPSGLVLWIICLPLMFWFFRFRAPDLVSLTFIALSVCLVLVSLMGRVLFFSVPGAGILLFFGLAALGVFSAAAFWLRMTAKALAEEVRDD